MNDEQEKKKNKPHRINYDKSFFQNLIKISQKYLINTLFDTINSILGVLMGVYLSGEGSQYIFIISIVSTAIALGISSGTSIYEAEYLEQLRELKELEKHMITNFEEKFPHITQKAKKIGALVGFINFATPLSIALLLIFVLFVVPNVNWAIWIIVLLCSIILFASGVYFGKLNQLNPVIRGVRMVVIVFITFIFVYLVGIIIPTPSV